MNKTFWYTIGRLFEFFLLFLTTVFWGRFVLQLLNAGSTIQNLAGVFLFVLYLIVYIFYAVWILKRISKKFKS